MSVPGVFAPTHVNGQILGDGGLVNNVPVDVARARPIEPHWSRAIAMAGVDSMWCYRADGQGADFRARMFSPLTGTWEDAATGSAATPLAGFLLNGLLGNRLGQRSRARRQRRPARQLRCSPGVSGLD